MQRGVKVAQPYLILCNLMDNGPPGSSVHGDFPGKNTGVDCHSFLQGSSCPGDQTQVSCIAGRFLLSEPPGKPTIQKTWVQFPGLGRSPGEGNGSPLQYPCLENSRDRGAWQAIVHGVHDYSSWGS